MTLEETQMISTSGVLIGHEIGEWSGFKAGNMTLKTSEGKRVTLRYGMDSEGDIPPIGSEIEVVHTPGSFPEIIRIGMNSKSRQKIYEDSVRQYENTLFFNRPKSAVVIALVEILAGLGLAFLGVLMMDSKPTALAIFTGCGIPHIIIGILLWEYAGK
jgi:hypothetical protein